MIGLPHCPFGDEESTSWKKHQGTYTSPGLCHSLPTCAKEDGPVRPCDAVPSGMKMHTNSASNDG